jgi:hypothetical protein
MSAGEPHTEQYTAWRLANAPGSRRQVILTRSDLIWFREGQRGLLQTAQPYDRVNVLPSGAGLVPAPDSLALYQ